jgi:hypothetical protein
MVEEGSLLVAALGSIWFSKSLIGKFCAGVSAEREYSTENGIHCHNAQMSLFTTNLDDFPNFLSQYRYYSHRKCLRDSQTPASISGAQIDWVAFVSFRPAFMKPINSPEEPHDTNIISIRKISNFPDFCYRKISWI